MSLELFKLTINKGKLRAETDRDVDKLPNSIIVCAEDEKRARSLKALEERWPESKFDPDSKTIRATGTAKDKTSDPTTLWDNPKYVTCSSYEGTDFPCDKYGIVYPPEKKDE